MLRWLLANAVALAALVVLLNLRMPIGPTIIGIAIISGVVRTAADWHRGSDRRGLTFMLGLCLLAMAAFATLWIPGAWTFAP